MVRLKVVVKCSIAYSFDISIPYGSIKSEPNNSSNCQYDISIPYGSIKRHRVLHYTTFNFISIPYGSIKSVVCSMLIESVSEFQFLMVRLKELALQTGSALIKFQFLMVRLKAIKN